MGDVAFESESGPQGTLDGGTPGRLGELGQQFLSVNVV